MEKENLTINQLETINEIEKRMNKDYYIDDKTTSNFIIVRSWNDTSEFETQILKNGDFRTSHKGLDSNSIWTEWKEDILPL